MVIIAMVVTSAMWFGIHCSVVYAENQSVQYTYDSLGRVQTVTYPGEYKYTYIYDKNGNIQEIQKEQLESTTEKVTTESKTETTTEKPSHVTTESTTEAVTGGSTSTESVTPVVHPTVEDIKAYNKFKKRKPVIKSLKQSKKKSKRYLNIQIKKLSNTGKYPETGYQIRYATDKKFKKAKSITITRNKKKSITSKKWKVKKKTYYVKIRAYMNTKTGKKIYSKFSKVKKIKVK